MKYAEAKQKKIESFDVNGIGADNGQLFGLPFNYEESEIIILPIPWEVTVSYKAGSAKGPDAILEASKQTDLYDHDLPDAWQRGIFMLQSPAEWNQKNVTLRRKAAEYIRLLESGNAENMQDALSEINAECEGLRKWIFEQTTTLLKEGKIVGLLGGDHSTPLGYMQACGQHYGEFGLLHIDAHADLREAYEGFNYSHASIMFNALQIPQLKKLVQVGLRDVCQAEIDIIAKEKEKISAFHFHEIKNKIHAGGSWKNVCDEIINALPQQVYISFDIDGLDPKLCPNTGTPVPGGFEMDEVIFLMRSLVDAGKTIIGFDLVEVAPGNDEWDGNVGARLLLKMCNLTLKSNGK
ncbi:MAG: agmatinase family protein [Chitinophagales bacterium]|nr:agmatinase family protein [Bacteroidota bacterium]MBK8487283.1 agmatinase family protein [Bacteroidota bacterium]